jgi:hypothetical protein
MKTLARPSLFGLLLAIGWHAAPAQAQDRLWVSSTGNNVNPCTRSLPCATFQEAHNKNSAGGIINCVDAGGYGTVSISKSITIDCIGTSAGIEPIADGTAIFINTAALRVILRGLTMDGRGLARAGVQLLTGGFLHLDNCRIAGFSGFGGSTGNGILLAPPAGMSGRLVVTDTVFSGNGSAANGGALTIQPSGSGSARVQLNRVVVTNNTLGVSALGSTSTGTVAVQIRDSVVSGNAFDGIVAQSAAGQAITSITVDRTSSLLNGADGIRAQGPPAYVTLGNSTVISNVIGLNSVGGGNIFSYQNNQVGGNFTDGAPTLVLAEK